MSTNPYEPPQHVHRSAGSWRAWWRRVCLGSVLVSAVMQVADRLFLTHGPHLMSKDWFLLMSGLLALVVLVCNTMIVVAAIGWILSRRPSTVP